MLLTKADAMERQAIGQLRDEGIQMKEAMQRAESLATQILSEVSTKIRNQLDRCKYPPKSYLPMSGELSSAGPTVSMVKVLIHEGMNAKNGDSEPLIRCTINALDDVELQKLVVSAQQINFDLNIEYATR